MLAPRLKFNGFHIRLWVFLVGWGTLGSYTYCIQGSRYESMRIRIRLGPMRIFMAAGIWVIDVNGIIYYMADGIG